MLGVQRASAEGRGPGPLLLLRRAEVFADRCTHVPHLRPLKTQRRRRVGAGSSLQGGLGLAGPGPGRSPGPPVLSQGTREAGCPAQAQLVSPGLCSCSPHALHGLGSHPHLRKCSPNPSSLSPSHPKRGAPHPPHPPDLELHHYESLSLSLCLSLDDCELAESSRARCLHVHVARPRAMSTARTQ